MKKTIMALLSLSLALTMFAGCDDKKPAESTPAATTTAGADTTTKADVTEGQETGDVKAEYDGIGNLRITDDPMTVTLFSAFGELGAPTGDMPIWQEGLKITGVGIENVANPSIADRLESLNVMLTSGTLPDVIFGMKGDIAPIIQQGGFIPLDDLIAEHAPNIQAYFDFLPEARVGSTAADGSVYFIEGTLSSTVGARETSLIPTMTFFIRQDWLTILDRKVPTTFEEFKETLYAFRNDDPNGNGQKDEIPFFFRDGSPVGLYQLFGVNGDWANWGIDTASKSVVYGRTTENYKNALRELAQWYKDGIIDPEILTRGSQARQELLANDIGGMTFDWYESTSNMNYNEEILAVVPGLEFLPMLPPADTNGVVKNTYSGAPTSGYAWGISKDCKDPVSVIKFMDFWFTETGAMLMSYGIEGQTYNMVDGKPVHTEVATSYSSGIPGYMRTIGAGGSVSGILEADISTKTEVAQMTYRMYAESGILMAPFPTLTFTEEEEEVMNTYNGGIDTLWGQYEQQVLYGQKNVDDSWEGYLAEMKQLGLDEVIAAYNSAYARYLAEFG